MVSRTQEKLRERLRKRQNLIDRYDIVFDGPIPSREWPNTYASVFQKLREIEDVKYEKYIPTLTGQSEINHYSGPISERVANLIRIAYDYRNSWANESDWRNCEKIVLDRFHTDIPCNYCRKRRWFPHIQLEPLCAAAVEELRTKRSRTTLCRCRQVDRVGDQSFKKLQSPFSFRGNEPVLDDSVAEYRTKELGKQKPDYVIGLRQTTKLKSLLSSHPDIKDTPFIKKLSPSFPFLLLEAKPEAGCPGFTSVEEQCAFPLRTLLNIQKNIPKAGDLTFDPLVWFMANQGDEWRVYACVPEGTKTRVIDLWHGTILREDNALQLLLIVDMICDWARDIYRKAVMKCLASAIPDLRGFTPADSTVSYNLCSGEETVEDQSNVSSSVVDSDSSTSVENFINRDVIIDLTSQDDPSENEGGNAVNYGESDVLTDVDTNVLKYSDPDVSTEVSRSSDTPSDIGAISLEPLMVSDVEMIDQGQDRENETAQVETWSQHAVIRHANDVLFLFNALYLPENQDDLITLLVSSSIGSDITKAAGKLVMLFRARNQILTRKGTIRQLEAFWTNSNGPREITANDDDGDIIIAHFSFESYFRQGDWELVRKLTCMVASSNTIDKLARISGIGHPVVHDYRGDLKCSRDNIFNAMLLLRDLSFEGSAKGAISHVHFNLRQDSASLEKGRPQYEWEKSTRQIRDALCILANIESFVRVSTSEKRGQARLPTQNGMFDLKFEPSIQTVGAFLVKKPESWLDLCPKYCLVVFDQSDIQDHRAMASKVSNAVSHQSLFYEAGRGPSLADTRALTLWIEVLSGEAPLDSSWPS